MVNGLASRLLFVFANVCFDDAGQITKYMRKYDVKYGFLTTYNETIFLKKEYRGDDWVLWHSRPISNNTTSTGVGQNLSDLADHVSVRECFLYLQTRVAANDWSAVNKTGKWHVDQKAGPINLDNYYINDDPSTELKSSAPEVPSLPGKQPGPRKSPRNPQSSTGKVKITTHPERSTHKSGEHRRAAGPVCEGKSSALDHTSSLSRSRGNGATSSVRMGSSHVSSDARQRIKPGVQGKDSLSIGYCRHVSSVEHLRRGPESSADKTQTRERRGLLDGRIQSSHDKAASMRNHVLNPRARDTEGHNSRVDTGHTKSVERSQTSNSRFDPRASTSRSDQPRQVEQGSRVSREGQRHRREEENRSRT